MATQGGRKRKLVEETSTLVYALFDSSPLPFEHFSLIVRSLHSYMVEEITPDIESKTVSVKLGYQASVKNAYAKLGRLTHHMSVTKASTFVKPDELFLLDKLQKEYGFGKNLDTPQPEGARSTKKGRMYQPSANLVENDSE